MKNLYLAHFATCAVVIGTLFTQCATAQSFDFEFNTDGVLPSSQGAIYGPTSNVPETQAFSVSGGMLHQNTLGTSGVAYYLVQPAFDHRFDATVEWSAKVQQSANFAADVALVDTDPLNEREWDFNLQTTGVEVNFPGVVVPLDTTNAFHVYKVTIPANSDAFSLFVDGTFRFSGNARVVPGAPNQNKGGVSWGDETGAGDAKLDWDYVRFANSTVTPEPGALPFLATSGLLGLGFCLIRRKRLRLSRSASHRL